MPIQPMALLGFATRNPIYVLLLFIADVEWKLNIAIRTPINGITSIPHIAVKTRIGPILWSRYQPVIYRVEMDVIDMLGKIPFIPNLMLPKSPVAKRHFLDAYGEMLKPLQSRLLYLVAIA